MTRRMSVALRTCAGRRARAVRRAGVALAAVATLAAAGCGKSNLATTTSASTPAASVPDAGGQAPTSPGQTPAGPGQTPAKPGELPTTPGRTTSTPGETAPTPGQGATTPPARAPKVQHTPSVAVPLALTHARAVAFAHAVQLTIADVPGAHEAPRSKTPSAREREAARCGGRAVPTVGEGRSPELQRGHGLERETISSSVTVLQDAHSVEGDLAYAQTSGGLKCYERVLTRSLRSEADPNVKLLGVDVAPLQVAVAGAGRAEGIRILARVGVPGAGVVVKLFVDALTLPYGPAEIDLFGTSFVQPVPVRTEQELLALLHQRALAQRL